MLEKDDADWNAILAGKEVPEADPNTAHEARLFREALHAEERLHNIIGRLEAEGHLKPETETTEESEKPRPYFNFSKLMTLFTQPNHAWIAIPAMLMIAMTIGWLSRPYFDQTPWLEPKSWTPRSHEPSLPSPTSSSAPIIEFYYSEPEWVAADLKTEFLSAGAQVQLTHKYQLNIQMPTPISKELQELCDTYDIDWNQVKSSSGSVRIIISETQ